MDTASSILKQVEFYFSDSNFRRDKFLQKAVQSSKDGFVAIETLLTFNRLKALTTDVNVVADALANSKLLQLNEEKTSVARTTELAKEDLSHLRKIYVKGLGDSATVDEVIDVFSPFGKVNIVHLLREDKKLLNGKAYVEFELESVAETVVKTPVEFKGHSLIIEKFQKGRRGGSKGVLHLQDLPENLSIRDIKKSLQTFLNKDELIKDSSLFVEFVAAGATTTTTEAAAAETTTTETPVTEATPAEATPATPAKAAAYVSMPLDLARQILTKAKETPLEIQETKISMNLLDDEKSQVFLESIGTPKQVDLTGCVLLITSLSEEAQFNDVKNAINALHDGESVAKFVDLKTTPQCAYVRMSSREAVTRVVEAAKNGIEIAGQMAQFSQLQGEAMTTWIENNRPVDNHNKNGSSRGTKRGSFQSSSRRGKRVRKD